MQFTNSILIEIPLGQGGVSEVTFPTFPFLRDKTIEAIEVIPDNILAVSPSGLTVIPAGEVSKLCLTFTQERQDDIQQIPAQCLVTDTNFGIVKFIKPRIINWDISTAKITDALSTTGFVLPLNVYYQNDKPAPKNKR